MLSNLNMKMIFIFFCAICTSQAYSNTIYNYAGNAFNSGGTVGSKYFGDYLIASVTFSTSISKAFSGDIYKNEISQWSIQVAQLPETKLDNNNAITADLSWPFWFHFESGQIVAWQMLAFPLQSSNIYEIYTTNSSPYGSINRTSDEFVLISGQSTVGNNPGTWTVNQTTIPEPSTLSLLIFGLLGVFNIWKHNAGKAQ